MNIYAPQFDSLRRVSEAATQMRKKRGPYYRKWLKAMRKRFK